MRRPTWQPQSLETLPAVTAVPAAGLKLKVFQILQILQI
jgi:hypothetical protein